MKRVLFVLGALAVAAFAANTVQLDRPLYIPGTDATLSYDDATANWLTWGGLYRGVWFNVTDFGTTGTWEADNTEFWFYHSSNYPWDVTSFYAEIFNGGVSGPDASALNQTSVTATHYTAAYANYSSPVICEDQFWVIVDTDMSSGGWPSLLSDNTSQGVDHSFYSDDFIVWQPWVPSTVGLARTTWAEVKTLFDIPRYRSTPGCVDYFIRASDAIGIAP